MISMLPLEVQKRFSITTKQRAEPLLVDTNGAPLVLSARQAIRSFRELGFLKNV